MIHTQTDFYNKLAVEIRAKYFANEKHGYTENKNYWTSTKVMEDFNNGCLTYRKFIDRLSKSCQDTTKNIHKIVEKFIVSFGEYKYQPSKF